jgi:DNA-binding MarR family transcriptional regulator
MTTITDTDLLLAARFRLAVTRLARRLRQQSGEGLTPSQTSALSAIERNAPLTPSELATIERVQRPTATRVLNALTEAGLVTREADPGDGRITRVKLTPAGTDVLARGRSRKTAYLARRMQQLGPEDLATLERAAELVERLLEDDADRPGPHGEASERHQ